MKIAICDDNHTELLHISQIVDEFIHAYAAEHNSTLTTYSNGMDLLATLEKGVCFDVILLDIMMPLMNGIELAKEIRSKDSLVKILFLTSSSDFAVDSYTVDAFYYLLKPIKKEELLPLLKKASVDIIEKAEKHILVKHGVTLSKIFLHNLEYAEVIGRSVIFNLKTGDKLEGFITMTQVEAELLTDKRFIKPHRSYVVNMDYIKNLAPEGITTVSKAKIPVSRNIFKEVKQAYINYLLSGAPLSR